MRIKDNYKSKLTIYETQVAIGLLKKSFEKNLSEALNVKRVSAPLFVESTSGLNDDLNGFEKPVSFNLKATNKELQIVHSLAKWKRLALYDYKFPVGEGLYTDMNAIRKEEDLDNIHSIYVDQWDWEKVITKEQRTIEYLKDVVRKIVHAISLTNLEMNSLFPKLSYKIEDEVSFITSEELRLMYPTYTPKERENAYVKEHPVTFLMQIGKTLGDGTKHDGRAPDYDDWELNGDILVYNEILDSAFEISSMGIRVDKESLLKQLKSAGKEERINLYFHQMLLKDLLPLTIGGGIGQSRLSMLLLEKAHIGEVQVSIWDENTINYCKDHNITLL